MTCQDLIAFVDGELDQEGADLMRAHIEGCERCQNQLVIALQDSARLSDLATIRGDWVAVGGDVRRAMGLVAESGTAWPDTLPRPESFTEATTKVERAVRRRDPLVVQTILAVGVLVTVTAVNLYANIGTAAGTALAAFGGVVAGCISGRMMLRRR